ncbi:hypothetical protein Q4Q57_00170 [Shewanella sp. SP2S2-6]|uniref:hypothetical protein n=1 Tax=Shewanella sp. SP2S2-6 TaxID=3063540 RepID=UPI00288FAF53|nr:hypothetical protein [Shewanella sp. SP2S2-6]MDT3293565.1 hypothetical protein [Shewanella sp. SP2S2-6]
MHDIQASCLSDGELAVKQDVVQVRPWMLDRPVHGADGRLANHHGSPFEYSRNLLIYKL